ncbi:uncharacterized protein LOC122027079 [Zingiber officinale]|uniref:uncharacterized protein LOC122027079 n=1 Tax=Zingiber officinale TaxID=94328 RepID=UPI001C4D8044|nr:uncharacterized protein LOC122027079 [Zingiber officinale]
MSQKKSQKPVREPISMKTPTNKRENIIVSSTTSSEVSEETEDKTIEEVKEIDVMDEAPVCSQSNRTADETVEENAINDDKVNAYQKIEEIDSRAKNLRKNSEKLLLLRQLSILLYQSMEVQHIMFTLPLGVFVGYIFMLANIGLRTRRLQLQKIQWQDLYILQNPAVMMFQDIGTPHANASGGLVHTKNLRKIARIITG